MSRLEEVLKRTQQARALLIGLAIILVMISIFLSLRWAPEATGFSAPQAQRIMYIHVPCAWVSFLAFGVLLVASIIYLRTGDDAADALAASAGEFGLVLCTLALVTGSIWAKEEWGVYWRTDDPKLTTTFVLWLLYLGYMVMRPASDERPTEKDARQAAVLGIVAFISVPLTFLSSRIWASLHPNVVATSEGSLSSEMGMVLVVAVVAMTLLFIPMLLLRVGLMLQTRDFSDKIEEAGRTKRTKKRPVKGGITDGR
jgi:heme exporter protein C